NVAVAAGALNAPPVPGNTDFQLNIHTQGRLSTKEEFGNIIVRTDADGSVVHLRDVARIELGSNQYALRSLLDNQPAVAIPIFARPGSNAIQISDEVRATMAQLKKEFPQGVDYHIVYDPTVFVRGSIEAVAHTLLEAIALVVLVVILFLQTWRASIIPLIAVPVSLIGTFAVMYLVGFSLNALSLFGMVLAIGIVVDDAIVVVENVERHIELGESPKEATRKAMREVTGPIVATALVLCAVFIPTAFISGLTGEFYRQFALTIAISTVISAFNSLTLSPALSAILLRPHDAPKDRLTRGIDRAFGWLFRPFNRLFHRGAERYLLGTRRLQGKGPAALAVYAALIALTAFGFTHVPTGFVPTQDKQYLVSFAQLPDAASLDRTEDVIKRMSAIALKQPGVESAVAFPGLSINGFTNASNAGIVFVTLKPFDERRSTALSAGAIAGALNQKFASVQDAYIAVFPPPPVMGLGTIGGFRMQIEDRGELGFDELYKHTQNLIAAGRKDPVLAGLFSSFQVNVPQVDVDVDREKAKAEGVDLGDAYQTMQAYLGSLYVNDFNRFGRTYQVNLSAEPSFRRDLQDISQLKTRNDRGDMVPLGSFVTVKRGAGPDRVMHYNGYPTAEINGGPALGYSSGQAQKAMEKLAHDTLPNGLSFEWTDLTYQQILAGNTAILVFPLCVLLVFLVLSSLYESWSLPLAVILIVPMVLLSAIAGVWLSGGDNNIFTQIGLIVLVGLACKNAILIVEFARERQLEGMSRHEAVLEAARLRLRPILMTSIAFIMGVVPLVTSHGAGAEMRHAMGVAVFSGMLGVTIFGLIYTPLFYVVIRALVERREARKHAQASARPALEGH
ncbi:MAG: efflux RND transporter permease subunit, partial [Rhodanobacteraceae bacterium]